MIQENPSEFVKTKCARCKKEITLQSIFSIRHYKKGGISYCLHCSEYFEYVAELEKLTRGHRCPNKDCIGLNSNYRITDEDEDYTEISCKWCGETFRIYHPVWYPEEYYYSPTPEEEQKMIDEYLVRRYGEC